MTAKTERASLRGSSSEQVEVSQYVADMSLELRSLCKARDMTYLAYLLEIVFIEASEQANQQAAGKPGKRSQGQQG